MRRTRFLVTLTICLGFSLLLLVISYLPTLVYPTLSTEELQGVVATDKRIELQSARYQLQEHFRGQLLQGLAGFFVIAGAVAAWQQIQVNRDGQITERFAVSIDQLGSDKLELRLGGIYALERIAKNSPRDRPAVSAILGAFVRSHAAWPVDSPDGPEHPTSTVDVTLPWLTTRIPDVQTAMHVLGRRIPHSDTARLFLSRVDLRSVQLSGAQLHDAHFSHANLARARMPEVNLENAKLINTDLRQANLAGAHLSGADLRGAFLQEADLRGATLHGADLRGANLEDALLDGTDLTDVRADVTTTWPASQVGR